MLVYVRGWIFYLWVRQAGVVRLEVVDDPLACSWQGDTAHQKHKQHDIWKGGCQVHHLQCTQQAGGMWSRQHRDRKIKMGGTRLRHPQTLTEY